MPFCVYANISLGTWTLDFQCMPARVSVFAHACVQELTCQACNYPRNAWFRWRNKVTKLVQYMFTTSTNGLIHGSLCSGDIQGASTCYRCNVGLPFSGLGEGVSPASACSRSLQTNQLYWAYSFMNRTSLPLSFLCGQNDLRRRRTRWNAVIATLNGHWSAQLHANTQLG